MKWLVSTASACVIVATLAAAAYVTWYFIEARSAAAMAQEAADYERCSKDIQDAKTALGGRTASGADASLASLFASDCIKRFPALRNAS